jgi:hypothetical protein
MLARGASGGGQVSRWVTRRAVWSGRVAVDILKSSWPESLNGLMGCDAMATDPRFKFGSC